MRADEFMAELAADPEYQARRRKSDEELRRSELELARAEAPVVSALNEAGVRVSSIWDLDNTAEPYPRALPILSEHLQKPYPPRVLERIAKAMALPESKFAWQTLLRLFRETPNPTKGTDLKFAIGWPREVIAPLHIPPASLPFAPLGLSGDEMGDALPQWPRREAR
jgi:hypothetical protein